MRKALAFIMVILVFCCSVLSAGDGSAAALRGAYDGILSAIASYLSEPRVTLQGVSVSDGNGFVPALISFVRSDVSTYMDSLSFFCSDGSYLSDGTTLVPLRQMLGVEIVRHYLQKREFKQGDVILDGSVRLLEWSGAENGEAVTDDWSDLHARFSVSLMATGTLCGEGIIMEGTISVGGNDDMTMTITTESLKVNDKTTEAVPIVLSFGR